MLALLVGAIEIGLGVAKLGFVADLLSKEVQVGYMNGLGITIIVGQLPTGCRGSPSRCTPWPAPSHTRGCIPGSTTRATWSSAQIALAVLVSSLT